MDFNNEVSMKRSLIILSILAMFLTGFSTLAFAEPDEDSAQAANSGERSMKLEGDLRLVFPEGWEKSTEENKGVNASVVLKDTKSEDKIEVYHRNMLLESSASMLFEQFRTHLEQNGLILDETPLDGSRTITLSDGNSRIGEYHVFKFSTKDITIEVVTYGFSVGLHAYIAVGYFIKAEHDPGIDAFEKMLTEMTLDNDN